MLICVSRNLCDLVTGDWQERYINRKTNFASESVQVKMVCFYSRQDVQLRVVFITGALKQSLLQVPTAAATSFICTAGHQFKTKTVTMFKVKGEKKSDLYLLGRVC